MKCVKCGAELASDSKFCNVCGEPAPVGGNTPTLVVENVTEAPAISVEPVTEAPVLTPVTPAPVTEAPVLAPVNVEPVTEAPVLTPVTPEPVTEAPTVAPAPLSEPVTEAPTVAPAPLVEPVAAAPAAVPTTPTPTAQNAAAPKKSNVGLILTIVLLVAIAAGCGIFVGRNLLKGKDKKEDDNPPIETVSTKTKVTFAEMEYEIPEDYEYYYDTLKQGSECLIIDMSNELELIIYDTGYSYYAFENAFDKIVKERYPDAITTLKKDNKYAFVNYRTEASGVIYYFYDGAVNLNTTRGLGTIIAKVDSNLEDKDLKQAMSIIETAKETRSINRSQGGVDNETILPNQELITSFASEEPETPVEEPVQPVDEP